MLGYAALCPRMPQAHFQLILSKIRAKKPYLGITLQIMVIKSSKNVVKMGRFYYCFSAPCDFTMDVERMPKLLIFLCIRLINSTLFDPQVTPT